MPGPCDANRLWRAVPRLRARVLRVLRPLAAAQRGGASPSFVQLGLAPSLAASSFRFITGWAPAFRDAFAEDQSAEAAGDAKQEGRAT